ncbi:MAG: sulfotransferase family 2 domain-containing protein [Paracoccaceae bacterium]
MNENISQSLFAIRRFPVRYLVIPKCACTYIKNVLWRLEEGENYKNPIRIHSADSQMLRASDLGITVKDVLEEEFAFAVLRNPVDRFYSLYADKVVGQGHKLYVPLRTVLATKYGLDVTTDTAEGHTRNCEILLEWLASNLKSEIDLTKDAHWTPQVYRKNILKGMNLKVLLVNDLDRQLSVLLSPLVPGIDQILTNLERNTSKKQFSRREVIVPSLRKKINTVFAQDRELFQRSRDLWKQHDGNTHTSIPRALDVLS